jgi:hypothetical protein
MYRSSKTKEQKRKEMKLGQDFPDSLELADECESKKNIEKLRKCCSWTTWLETRQSKKCRRIR